MSAAAGWFGRDGGFGSSPFFPFPSVVGIIPDPMPLILGPGSWGFGIFGYLPSTAELIRPVEWPETIQTTQF